MKQVKREPIKVQRTAIKLSTGELAQLRLLEMQKLTREDDILEIIAHYEMLAMNILKKGGYSIVSRNHPTKHKNWIHFEYVYEICRIKDWSPRMYIDSQFDRVSGWRAQFRIPPPNTLYSDNAIIHASNYLANIKKTYKEDVGGRKKEEGRITKSLRKQVIDDIVSSIDALSRYIGTSKIEDKSQYKVIKIFQSWGEFSPFYLWTIPWFHKVLNELPQDNKKVIEYKGEFERISHSPSLIALIRDTTRSVEDQLGIPGNIQL